MLIKTSTRKLACKLTDDELRSKGDELAVTCQEIKNQETKDKQIRDQLKMELSALQSKQGSLALIISRREDYRDVEVTTEYIETGDAQGQVMEKRTDTGEVIIIRPPMDSERQPKLQEPIK